MSGLLRKKGWKGAGYHLGENEPRTRKQIAAGRYDDPEKHKER
jgi:hypothetical protein